MSSPKIEMEIVKLSVHVQSQPRIHLPDAKAKALMERIQNAGTEVVEAKVTTVSSLHEVVENQLCCLLHGIAHWILYRLINLLWSSELMQTWSTMLQAGKGSATLSMAYAAAKFAESCLKAIQGQPGVMEYAYVSSHLTELPFFASPLRLGPNGIEVCRFLCCICIQALSVCCSAPSLQAPWIGTTC